MTLAPASVENVHKFCDIWNEAITQIDAHSRRTRRDNTLLQDYVVEEITGNNAINMDEMQRLFYSTLDQVINEIDVRFSYQNTKLYAAVSAFQPGTTKFWDVKMVQLFWIWLIAQVWKQNLMLLKHKLQN